VARQVGLPAGRAISGVELQKMSDAELVAEIENISVFARIEPLHKLRIVNALKANGEIVAMTGDGVNDAPALKAADIGVSMGISGTDVAKEASDMVLADDNFASVVAAVDEGRAIFTRLRNVLFYTLNTNLSELMALILALVFIGQSPLLAVQILWVNLVTDTAGDIPLGLEPKFGDELKQPPRHPGVGLIYPGLFVRIMVMAVLIGLGTFLIFRWAEARMNIEEARTLAFCAIVAFEWLMAFSARSDEHTIFRIGVFRNRALVLSIGAAVLLQVAVVYVPFLQIAFRTFPLTVRDWAIVVVAAGGAVRPRGNPKSRLPETLQLRKVPAEQAQAINRCREILTAVVAEVRRLMRTSLFFLMRPGLPALPEVLPMMAPGPPAPLRPAVKLF
jgi:Ca2+-transporting ATPase